jgi:hypothetical protein
VPGRRKIELARVGLGERDQLGHRARRDRRIDHQDIGLRPDQADRREVGLGVEIDLLVERRVGGEDGVVAGEQRVAVGRRVGHGLGRDVAAGARPVVDDDRLPQDLLKLAAEDAGEHVARPARREGDHQHDRPGRVVRGARRRHVAQQHKQPGQQRQPSPAHGSPRSSLLAP